MLIQRTCTVSFRFSQLAAALLPAFTLLTAQASGYHFGTQSVSAQSTANSSAAEADDASTLFYNPAGLTHLDSNQISASVNLVAPNVYYNDASATYTGGSKVSGSTGGNLTEDIALAPHVYGAYRLNDSTVLGLGMYIPFGSGTEYDEDAVTRYNLNKTELTTVAIEPALAYKINPKHSVAAGVIAQYAHLKLRKYADWGSRLGASGYADGAGNVKLKDWASATTWLGCGTSTNAPASASTTAPKSATIWKAPPTGQQKALLPNSTAA